MNYYRKIKQAKPIWKKSRFNYLKSHFKWHLKSACFTEYLEPAFIAKEYKQRNLIKICSVIVNSFKEWLRIVFKSKSVFSSRNCLQQKMTLNLIKIPKAIKCFNGPTRPLFASFRSIQ